MKRILFGIALAYRPKVLTALFYFKRCVKGIFFQSYQLTSNQDVTKVPILSNNKFLEAKLFDLNFYFQIKKDGSIVDLGPNLRTSVN